MQALVKDGQLVQSDPWTLVGKEVESLEAAKALGDHLLLPLELWLDSAEKNNYDCSLGVWIDSDEDPDRLLQSLDKLEIIAINFPVFTDGRGYSHASRLRLNHAFKGELRAIGDVLRDQLQFYQRCGFSSFAMRSDVDAVAAIDSLSDFSIHYQDATDNYLPPFARR